MKIVVPLLLVLAGVFLYWHHYRYDDYNPEGKRQGIQFIVGDWNKALAEAKKQNKPIFMDAYTSWCVYCKQLKRETFPNQETGEFFNQHFINVAIDMEKGDGPALSNKYAVESYPTLIILDSNGNVISKDTRGFINPSELLAFGKASLGIK
ncbi:MAG: thioredoxin family protein [Bacteroidetes bacterium]|nr:thioredoxin family protein [Bacteroidota bacterium]